MNRNHYKTIEHLGYRVEYGKLSKVWFVVDWDYERPEGWVVATLPTKLRALLWIEERGQ